MWETDSNIQIHSFHPSIHPSTHPGCLLLIVSLRDHVEFHLGPCPSEDDDDDGNESNDFELESLAPLDGNHTPTADPVSQSRRRTTYRQWW
mmetsp:Transcript_19884/g.47382  ORF Transcript_19884/g.47382 Transcript_19884/m.47382 type:complete len:91 (-) Transcript_19884:1963-2235(-)